MLSDLVSSSHSPGGRETEREQADRSEIRIPRLITNLLCATHVRYEWGKLCTYVYRLADCATVVAPEGHIASLDSSTSDLLERCVWKESDVAGRMFTYIRS